MKGKTELFYWNKKKTSKIVNPDGTPMIVYHGTNADFSIFDVNKSSDTTRRYIDGFYFTTEPRVAEKIAKLVEKTRGGKANVLPVYLDVRKPLVFTAEEYQRIGFDSKWREEILGRLKKGRHDGVIIQPESERVPGVFEDSCNYDADANVYANAEKYGITDKGYAWWLNRAVSNTDFTATQIAVFKPEQVKYATENLGTYDRDNPDMMYQERTETPEPSEVLRELFETNAAFAGYKSYTASLKKYQELMHRVDSYERQIVDIDANIARLRSERLQLKLQALNLRTLSPQLIDISFSSRFCFF